VKVKFFGGEFMYTQEGHSIQSFIQGSVLVLPSTATAEMASRAMLERRVGSVVVAGEDGKIVGIVTDRDLVCNVLAMDLPRDTPLSEVMTQGIVYVESDASVPDVIEKMTDNGIRRVPVVTHTRTGRDVCLGIVSLDDLLVAELVSPHELRDVVMAQVVRRIRRPNYKSKERSERRQEHTYFNFRKFIADEAGIDVELAESVVLYLFSKIIQRISYTGAGHFISQLPKKLQEDLYMLPAGPNRDITSRSILEGLQGRFDMDEDLARSFVRTIWRATKEYLSSNEPNQVLVQLPQDIQLLLMGETEFTEAQGESRDSVQPELVF
jgi:CBS domain-containing protein/uncharacterized protein (DUF2267 family)